MKTKLFRFVAPVVTAVILTGCTGFSATEGFPKQSVSDYIYMWWPDGFEIGYSDMVYFASGNYGMSFNTARAAICSLGGLAPRTKSGEQNAGNASVDTLDQITGSPAIVINGVRHALSSCVSTNNDGSDNRYNTSRIIDSGNAMQRMDIERIEFDGAEGVTGHLEIAATPEAATLSFNFKSSADIGPARLEYVLETGGGYIAEKHENILIIEKNGSGIAFVAHDGAAIEYKNGQVIMSAGDFETGSDGLQGFSVAMLPRASDVAKAADTYYLRMQNVVLNYTQEDGAEKTAAFDKIRGTLSVEVPPKQFNYTDEKTHDISNTIRFTIKNSANEKVTVPVSFDDPLGTGSLIMGGSPVIYTADTYEPTGIPVQISKNWHKTPEVPLLYEGPWYHNYALIEVPANGNISLIYEIFNARMGEVYCVSHAQLCLIGWGENQLWEESALGCFGESITYDPDVNLNRSQVDDIRAFAVTGMNDIQPKWGWTGNVGGLDFLVYSDAQFTPQKMGRMKVSYDAQAPCLTDVLYDGVSKDGLIKSNVRIQMGATDDIVRTWYTLTYEALGDAPYASLDFFQMNADHYKDNYFTKWAVGDADGVISSGTSAEIDGLPITENAAGKNPWFFKYDSDVQPEETGNIGFIVRSYNAEINGASYTSPRYRTVESSQIEFALIPNDCAEDMSGILKKGSKIEIVVEFFVTPRTREDYYGPSEYINSMTTAQINSPEMALLQARDAAYTVTSRDGGVVHASTAFITAKNKKTVRFETDGGLGYIPVTVGGLKTPAGWVLEIKKDGKWMLSQHDAGQKHLRQCVYRPESGTYELTYNLPGGKNEYRLRLK